MGETLLAVVGSSLKCVPSITSNVSVAKFLSASSVSFALTDSVFLQNDRQSCCLAFHKNFGMICYCF